MSTADRTAVIALADRLTVGVAPWRAPESVHWTGEIDGYIGELVVREDFERLGVGRQLVDAAESWGAARGLRRIRLSTGAANTAALTLYDALGYQREDVTLSKPIAPGPDGGDLTGTRSSEPR